MTKFKKVIATIASMLLFIAVVIAVGALGENPTIPKP